MKCKSCKHCRVHYYGSSKMIYCNVNKNYPSAYFIRCWGCPDYKKDHEQLDLFDISEKEVEHDHTNNRGTKES